VKKWQGVEKKRKMEKGHWEEGTLKQRAMRNEWINKNSKRDYTISGIGSNAAKEIIIWFSLCHRYYGGVGSKGRRRQQQQLQQLQKHHNPSLLKAVMPHWVFQHLTTRTNHFLHSAPIFVYLQGWYNSNVLRSCNSWVFFNVHLHSNTSKHTSIKQ